VISRRGILVGVPSGALHRATIEAAIDLAKLFRLPVTGLFVEEQAALDLCAVPNALVWRETATRQDRPSASVMATAMARQSNRIRSELEGIAVRARLEVSFAVRRGALIESVTHVADPGDLVVMPIDLTDRRLGPLIEAAAQLCRRTAGLLLVPETRPARAGTVVALCRANDAALAERAADIAEGLSARLRILIVDATPSAREALNARVAAATERAPAAEIRPLAAEARLTAEACGEAPVRLVVAPPELAGRIFPAGPESALRRYRPAVLLSEARETDDNTSPAPEAGRAQP